MRIISRYLLWEWIKSFLLATGITLGILLLNNMYGELPDLIDTGASSREILRYYLVLTPSFLPIVIPLTMLISGLFTLTYMHRNNEIIAMQASGLNIFQITKSLWITSIILCGLSLYLNASLVPWSVIESRNLKNNLIFSNEARTHSAEEIGLIRSFTFDNFQDRRLWFINRFSQYTYQGFGVYIFQLDTQGREIKRLEARETYFDDAKNEWVLLNGREMTMDPLTSEPIRSLPFDQMVLDDWDERPEMMQALSEEPKNLSFFELRDILKKIPPATNPQISPYAVRYNRMIASALTPLVVFALAIPFATSGVRTNPMVNISKCAALFFLFYFFESISTLMCSENNIPILLAAWAPNLLILGVAMFLYRKVL